MINPDERTAGAIVEITEKMPEQWALLEHLIALNLVKMRDRNEDVQDARAGGFCKGLRFLFEIKRRSMAIRRGEKFTRDMEITGEEAFIIDPLKEGEDEDR